LVKHAVDAAPERDHILTLEGRDKGPAEQREDLAGDAVPLVFDLMEPRGTLSQIPIVAQQGVKRVDAYFARGDILARQVIEPLFLWQHR
jgi:hypothetical protein